MCVATRGPRAEATEAADENSENGLNNEEVRGNDSR